jgi:hypothetical protein
MAHPYSLKHGVRRSKVSVSPTPAFRRLTTAIASRSTLRPEGRRELGAQLVDFFATAIGLLAALAHELLQVAGVDRDAARAPVHELVGAANDHDIAVREPRRAQRSGVGLTANDAM